MTPNLNPNASWVGFDLDGTLARHDPGDDVSGIGRPIERMVARLRSYVERGVRVKIFTARGGDPRQRFLIRAWLAEHGLPRDLEVTNIKDYLMLYFYDDRARQVVPNLGVVVGEREN